VSIDMGLSPAVALYSKRLAILVPCAVFASVLTWHRHDKHDLHAGLFPFHSPLLRESRLFSFPQLSDMLKFSG